MKQTIMGIAIVSTLVFTATAWSQQSPTERGKMGMAEMEMAEMEMAEMEMGEMETTNATLDELVGRMRAADGAEKMAAMEELLTALVAQRREMHKMMRSMPKMMCGGMMGMMMK